MTLKELGEGALRKIKEASWFPYHEGHLRDEATKGYQATINSYVIEFDEEVCPYINALEYGSSPHNIPGAFGRDEPFGMSGRFEGKFHPGSDKHKGFISEKSVNAIADYIKDKLNGIIIKEF